MNAVVRVPPRRFIAAVLLAWLAVLGFDLFLHAGVMASLFFRPDPFLLSPEELFRLIPLGYLSFLIFITLLAWLMTRLRIDNWRSGARFGFLFGSLVHGSLVLGLASISTAPYALLLGWFIGQSLQATLAAGTLGAAFSATNVQRVALIAVAFVILCIVLTVALQSTGLVRTGP